MREPARSTDALDTFDAVYERELSYVWKTLGRLGVAPSELPDAVHDVFIVVFRRWDELDPSRPVRGWLFGIARRIAAASRRKTREELRDDLDPPTQAVPHAERDLVWRALARVVDDRREVVILHELDGFTAVEIAEILGIPLNTVYSRLRVGRTELVAAIADLEGPA